MKSATWIGYEAWLKTDRPIIYNTRDEKGDVKVVNVDLLSPEMHERFVSDASGECVVCGSNFTGGVLASRMFGTNYTDWSRHKNPEGQHVCRACAWSMMLNVATGRQMLSRYSFVASTDGLVLCNRIEMRDALVNPPVAPFVAVCAVSQKKHLLTKAPVSYSRDRFQVMLEEEIVDITLTDFIKDVKTVEALRGLGCTKEEIESRNFRYERLKDWGMENMESVLDILMPMAKRRQFQVALFVAQKNEDQEDCRCYLNFKQRT